MRCQIVYGVLALALGASAAHAQTVITGPVVGQPAVVAAPPAVVSPAPRVAAPAVVQPAATIQTIQTVRTVRTVRTVHPAPLPPIRRQVVTRTITRRVVPAAPAVVAETVAPAPAPLYDTTIPAAAPAPLYGAAAPIAAPAPGYGYADYADYGPPSLYNAAPAAAIAPAPAVASEPVLAPAPVVAAPVATAPVIYRYVYEPGRILVIDPATNIAVQAIPR